MGILDNVTAAVNRGMESAGREAERLKLKNQINEINRRRQQLAAQLGASLYEATKDAPELRAGREALYDGIAACDAERADAQRKIDELDAMALAATVAASNYKCSVCGSTVAGGDLFCSGCGTPAAQARSAGAPATGIACAACGAAMNEGDAFCMSCGAKAQVDEIGEAELVENSGIGDAELIEDAGLGEAELIEGAAPSQDGPQE